MDNNTPINSKFQEKKKRLFPGLQTIWRSKALIAMILLLISVVTVTGAKIYFNIKGQKEFSFDKKINNEPDDTSVQKPIIPDSGVALKKIKDIEEVRQLFEQNNNQPSPVRGFNLWGASFATKSSNEMINVEANAPTPIGDYSTTNIQVDGVDEADIIQNDGKYFYIATPATRKVVVVEAYPAEKMKIVSTIELGGTPANLFLHDNRLVVFGQDQRFYDDPLYKTFIRRSQYTFVEIYDVSDKKNPKMTRSLHLEGNYITARAIDDMVYMITENNSGVYYSQEPPLPRIFDDRTLIEQDNTTPIYRMPGSDPLYATVMATTIPINGQSGTKIHTEHYLLPNIGSVYMSHNALYLTHTKYMDEEMILLSAYKEFLYDRLPQDYKRRINEIDGQEYYILSSYEKKYKIRSLYERYLNGLLDEEIQDIQKRLTGYTNKYKIDHEDEMVQTIIHKFSREAKLLKYTNSGWVPGTLLDQFSLDEYDGNLRIATTREAFVIQSPIEEFIMERRESTNSVFVLDKNLSILGKLTNLAPEERIYATRFMGERLYMVTFKNIDPFFVIDLKTPSKPNVLGYLKIPGFSEYLHPYKDSYIIGLGRETITNEYGAVIQEGLKLSLFDVSNVSEPKEIDTKIIGGRGSYSNALDDHKAFFFAKEKNILAIPVTLTQPTQQNLWGGVEFQGAIVFDISESGFKLKGRVSHEPIKASTPEMLGISNLSPIKRIHYINEQLYTLSELRLQANSLFTLKNTSSLTVQEENPNNYPVPYIKETPDFRLPELMIKR